MNNVPNNSFFVTGTDTDIGKTYVCRVLADAFALFSPVTYMKPIAAGCGPNGSDFDCVMRGRARPVCPVRDHQPYRFKKACSPHLAASLAGRPISLRVILNAYHTVRAAAQGVVLIEGAGGLMAPLSSRRFMIDLVKRIKAPVVLVTGPHLGTLNHTFLSIEALRSRQIPLAGVVVNNARNLRRDFIYADNLETIRRAVRPAPVLELDHGEKVNGACRTFCKKIAG